MIQINTLKDIQQSTITATFNEAFSDYVIPFQVTEESLKKDMLQRRVSLPLSVGAFDGENLVGYILIGIDTIQGNKVSYNAGTGVIPSYRRKGVSKMMYAFLLPLLKGNGIKSNVLEVIISNDKAIQLYQSLNYDEIRELNCYKGGIKAAKIQYNFTYVQIPDKLTT